MLNKEHKILKGYFTDATLNVHYSKCVHRTDLDTLCKALHKKIRGVKKGTISTIVFRIAKMTN